MTEYTDIKAVNAKYTNFPSGRYEQYEKRMLKLSKVIRFIKKHRILFSAVVIAFAAAILTLTYCAGIFTESIVCEDMIYGEKFNVTAGAFLTRVRYEYSSDGNEWTDSSPITPGEYYVRGVTKNLFGKERYSDSAVFTLAPRSASIEITEVFCQYGNIDREFLEKLTAFRGLAEGDELRDIRYELNDDDWKRVEVSVKEYTIINSDGTDVTECYNVNSEGGIIAVEPRRITVSTQGGAKEYDGLPVVSDVWSVSSGTLAAGDTLKMHMTPFPSDAGEYVIVPEKFEITDSEGNEVTYKYEISFDYGVYTVRPIQLSFSTESDEKIYDGKTLTNPNWTMTGGAVLEGHTITAEAVGTRTIVGKSKNVLSVIITDENKKDVTHNYNILVDAGELTINPILLTFTTDSAQKVYDGKLLQAPGYKLISGQLLPGHRLEGEANGMLIDVGEKDNTLLVMIYNENNVNVTAAGYEIVVEYGTLKITPRPITIASSSAQKLYDATALTAHSFSVSDNSLVNGDVVNPTFTGSQTEVGESPNYFTAMILNGGRNCTKNYDITYKLGTLTVLPNDDYNPNDPGSGNIGNGPGGTTVGPEDGAGGSSEPGSNGDGTTDGMFGVGGATGIGFPPTDAPEIIYARVKLTGSGAYPFSAFLRATSYGDYNGSGFDSATDYNKLYMSPLDFIGRSVNGNRHSLWTITVERNTNCPVIIPYYSYDSSMFGTSDSYFLSGMNKYDYKFVKLTDSITEMREYIHDDFSGALWDYTQFVYSEYLQIPDYTKTEMLRIGKENGIDDTKDIFILADSIRKYVQNAGTYNLYGAPYPESVDVAVYFLDVAKEGVCQHFAAAATMMYRAYGIPARYVTGFSVYLEPDTTVSLSTFDRHAWVEIFIDSLGWIPVEVTGSGFGVPGTKNEVSISAYNAVKEYDGQPFGEWNGEKVVINEGRLLPGHTAKIDIHEDINHIKPGIYKTEILKVKIYDSNGNDVTDKYYKVSYTGGKLTINKRKLVIQLGSASKTYDGTPLKCEEWRLVSGTILPNTEIRVETIGEITEVGTAVNQILHVYVYETKNGITKDVSDCYDITALPGRLEITE